MIGQSFQKNLIQSTKQLEVKNMTNVTIKKKYSHDLEIIIVNFNSQFWLRKTLETLQDFYLSKTKKKVLVTVVDNGSEDDSIKIVKKDFNWVQLIELKENLGFSAANNKALELSTAEYAMLVNSDVEFIENSNLDILLAIMKKNPEIGVITPRVEFKDGTIDPACHRGEPDPWTSLTYFSKLSALFPNSKIFGEYHQTYKNQFEPHQIDACSGAAMLVRKSAMDKVGVLDERFFMYAEDLDWCKRFRESGFVVYFFPAVVVIHHKHKSGIKNASQKIARKTRMHFYDTMLQYYDKHYRDAYPEFVRTLLRYFLIIKKGAL